MLWPGQKGCAELSHSHLFAGSQAASLSSSPSFVVVMGRNQLLLYAVLPWTTDGQETSLDHTSPPL